MKHFTSVLSYEGKNILYSAMDSLEEMLFLIVPIFT